jgi:hypothetical protein
MDESNQRSALLDYEPEGAPTAVLRPLAVAIFAFRRRAVLPGICTYYPSGVLVGSRLPLESVSSARALPGTRSLWRTSPHLTDATAVIPVTVTGPSNPAIVPCPLSYNKLATY